MPGGVLILKTDLVVASIPARDTASLAWNSSNAGQGVIVLNAYKDFPAAGQGDATVGSVSSAYYKWTGAAFIKISEGEGLDQVTNFVKEYFNGDGATTQFNINAANTVLIVEVGGQIIEPIAGPDGYTVAGQVVTLGFAPEVGQRVGIYHFTNLQAGAAPINVAAMTVAERQELAEALAPYII